MSYARLRPTYTFDQDRIERLRAVVPEAFADGRIHWETLREVLGDQIEDEGVEHFGLSWPGKRAARQLAGRPSRGTLVPAPGEGVNEERTSNGFIEGENLEVLKLLLKSYARKVKMIYIDPPYNTGEDFIYNDDFREPLETYLRRSKQADEEGLLTSNPKSSGRFHSNWLNMIYPRLVVARDFLTYDGSIWISISDEELANLQMVCDEIFGPGNFVATFIWEKRTTRENRKVFSNNLDYILCYAKDKDAFQASRNMLPLTEEVLGRYSNPDNDPRGDWQSVALTAQAGHGTAAQFYTIVTPGGREVDPPPGNCWRYTHKKLRELINDNRIWFGAEGNNVPRRKLFMSEANEGLTPHTLWKADEVGTTDSAKRAIMELFDGQAVFDTPKPVELIQRILHIATDNNDTVMDFYAGSATTAQSVLSLNRVDNGTRSFILVQLPEVVRDDAEAAKMGLVTIADIGKERIGKPVARMQEDVEGRLNIVEEDLGFKVYRLDRSHYKQWDDYTGDDVGQLQMQLDAFETPLVDDWRPADLLVEVMLMEGFPLDSSVRWEAAITANEVRCVQSDFYEHRLWVCLDTQIEDATVEALDIGENDVFVCLDRALSDESKVRLSDTVNLKTI